MGLGGMLLYMFLWGILLLSKLGSRLIKGPFYRVPYYLGDLELKEGP